MMLKFKCMIHIYIIFHCFNAYIRVKIRIGITDRLRFFRRVRFETGERAMIDFKYERLRRICINCGRINHLNAHCLFLASYVIHVTLVEAPLVHVCDEGQNSNSTHRDIKTFVNVDKGME